LYATYLIGEQRGLQLDFAGGYDLSDDSCKIPTLNNLLRTVSRKARAILGPGLLGDSSPSVNEGLEEELIEAPLYSINLSRFYLIEGGNTQAFRDLSDLILVLDYEAFRPFTDLESYLLDFVKTKGVSPICLISGIAGYDSGIIVRTNLTARLLRTIPAPVRDVFIQKYCTPLDPQMTFSTPEQSLR